MKKNRLPLLSLLLLLVPTVANAWDRGPALGTYVDPRIGSEGLGRVVVGPSCPFGMVKPSPDCTVKPNSGWLPMPAPVNGFSQTHVSGTGGGPKYGNVLIQPFCSGMDRISHPTLRRDEDISLAYYGTTFENGIRVEVTTAERASQYRRLVPRRTEQTRCARSAELRGFANPDCQRDRSPRLYPHPCRVERRTRLHGIFFCTIR